MTQQDAAAAARAEQVRRLYEVCRIDEQRDFYRSRQREYERARVQAVGLRTGLLVLAGLMGVLASVLSGTPRALAGVAGAVLAALAAAVTSYETLMGFSPLAKLYGDAAANVDLAAAGWEADAVWSPTRLGRRVSAVERVLQLEAAQWGQLVLHTHADLGPGEQDDDEEDDPPPRRG